MTYKQSLGKERRCILRNLQQSNKTADKYIMVKSKEDHLWSEVVGSHLTGPWHWSSSVIICHHKRISPDSLELKSPSQKREHSQLHPLGEIELKEKKYVSISIIQNLQRCVLSICYMKYAIHLLHPQCGLYYVQTHLK